MTDETSTADDPINSNTAPLIVKLLYENSPELNKDLLTAKLHSMDPMIPAYNFNSAQVVGNVKTQALSKLS